jgi:hypothetical protein
MVTQFIWLRIRDSVAVSCEQGNKLLSPMKRCEFLEWLCKKGSSMEGGREGMNE